MFTHPLSSDAHLRPVELRDVDEMAALIDAERERLSAWMPWAPGSTRETTHEWAVAARRQLADDDGFQAVFVVGGRLAGSIGMHGVDRDEQSTSIGYWIAAEHEGRGLVTRAAAAITRHAFTDLGLHRVQLRAARENRRSRAVAERLGFAQEGVLREAEPHAGGYRDLVLYAALATEWTYDPAS